MQQRNDERRDPFARLPEPVEELGLTAPASVTLPAALARRGGRKTPVRPAERRRRERMATFTFSDAAILDRLRALAERWGMNASGGPNVSALVEYLLLPQLEAAEQGRIEPPSDACPMEENDTWF